MVSAIKASSWEQPFWQNLVYRIWRADRRFLDFSHRFEAPEDASKRMPIGAAWSIIRCFKGHSKRKVWAACCR